MEMIRHDYPALQFNLGFEPTVRARCGTTIFTVPLRVLSLCEELAKDLNWKIMKNSPLDYVIVDPMSYDMDPQDVKQFYDELNAMCSHVLHETADPVIDMNVYEQHIWNKVAYAVQYGASFYLKRILDSLRTPAMLSDPVRLCHILKTLITIDGCNETRLSPEYQDSQRGTCNGMMSHAISCICKYICENSIFPLLAHKISSCSREYTRSYMRIFISQHNSSDDLANLRDVVPTEMLTYILGIRKTINGEMELLPLPFQELTSTSACIIAGYLEMIGFLPPWCAYYSSTRSVRPTPGCPRHYTLINTVSRGVNFNTSPFVIGMLESGVKILIFTSPTDNQAKIALDISKEKKLASMYGLTVNLTMTLEDSNGHEETAKLTVSWDREHTMKASHMDTNIDRFLLSTTCDRRYFLEVTETPHIRPERRMTC